MNRDWALSHGRIFVYGTLRRGFANHSLLTDCPFLGLALTSERYSLWMGVYPHVCRHPSLVRIRGELYTATAHTLALLDILEDHPVLYQRELTPILVDDGRTVPAWMYFFPKPSGVAIPSGDFTKWS